MLVYRKLHHYIVRVSMLLSVHNVNGHSAQGKCRSGTSISMLLFMERLCWCTLSYIII
jgi:hypothetical protein